MKLSFTTAFFSAMVIETMAQNTMVKMCLHYDNESGHARSDPIIDQNCASGHVHTFYGPQNFHPNTSYEDIRDTPARYSSSPFVENQSLYWHPAIYEVVSNRDGSTTYTRVNNLDSSTYYRWDNTVLPRTEAFPPGFRMIAHADDLDADVHGQTEDNTPIRTECCNFDGDDQSTADEVCEFWDTITLPNDRSCDDLGIAFSFPTCWDGQSLGDDNDHRSHMAYTTNGMIDGPCPTGFPRRLPEAQIFVRINSYDSTNKSYQLSDRSNVFHADFFNGWEEGKLQQIIDNCQTDTSDDFGYNPPCSCTPDDAYDSTFLTTNNRVASRVCDVDVRELIIDEATDVTNNLPSGSCEGPALKPKSWTQISSDLFDCAVTPTTPGPVTLAPVQRPTGRPTLAPVAAPTPTQPPLCADVTSFVANNGRTRNCPWVAKRFNKRCRKYSQYCPVTCGVCPTTPAPIPAPTPNPTLAPVPSPTMAPVTGSACYDRVLAFRNSARRDCSWVARNPNQRCGREWQEKSLWEWCPSTCSVECYDCCDVSVWECEDAITAICQNDAQVQDCINREESKCTSTYNSCTQTCD